MKYFKDWNGVVYAYEDNGSQDAFIQEGLVRLSDSELEEHLGATEPTVEQIEAQKVAVVQQHMDAAARALRYDDIKTAVTYAEEPAVPKFQAEGQAFRAWRSLVWARCYEILDEVQSGARPIPSDEELIAELPELEL